MNKGGAARERILKTLAESHIPMDVENVRVKSGLKNWESTKALLLELLVEGAISGQKTTKSWIFWSNSSEAAVKGNWLTMGEPASSAIEKERWVIK